MKPFRLCYYQRPKKGSRDHKYLEQVERSIDIEAKRLAEKFHAMGLDMFDVCNRFESAFTLKAMGLMCRDRHEMEKNETSRNSSTR